MNDYSFNYFLRNSSSSSNNTSVLKLSLPILSPNSPVNLRCVMHSVKLLASSSSNPRFSNCYTAMESRKLHVWHDSMSWWEGVDETRLLVALEPSETGKCVGQLLSLRHPKSGNSTCFLLANGALQEIHWFKQSYVSWFVGDYICEDGRLYTATPVDPVFILLPIFEEARMKKGDDPGKFRQLDEMVFVNGYPAYRNLLSIVETSMQVVCDFKEIGSIKVFRLNDSKVLAWLNYKVDQLKRTLLTLDKNYAARDEKDILTDAVSVLGEYLKEEPWLKLLCSNLKLDVQAVKTADVEVLPTAMGNGPMAFEAVQEKSGSDKKTTRSARQTKKAKVETDSRNIRDMFSRASRRK